MFRTTKQTWCLQKQSSAQFDSTKTYDWGIHKHAGITFSVKTNDSRSENECTMDIFLVTFALKEPIHKQT
jgi:hypothetical protein